MTDSIVAAILGVVEGVTEFLPVSSTGHLLIAEHWFPLARDMDKDLFNVVIQCGAVLAVIPLFRERFHQFIHRWSEPAVRDYFLKIMLAFVITGAGGFIMDKKNFKLPEELTPVAYALLVGGIVFFVVEGWVGRDNKERSTSLESVTWTVAVAVGIGQLIAAGFPGASRSGTTIMLALILGLNRSLATEFSFLAGIPTMTAAGGYKIFKAFHHPVAAVHENWTMVWIASIIAAVVSFVVVKWFLRFVQTHTFVSFGCYRVVLAGLILAGLHTGYLSDKETDEAKPKAKAVEVRMVAGSYWLEGGLSASGGENVLKSGGGPPHSRTLRGASVSPSSLRVLQCGGPPPLWDRGQRPARLSRTT
jgi:undecaprenyl-diphosphatase